MKINKVRSNHARAEEIERLPDDPDEADEEAESEAADDADSDETTDEEDDDQQRLGSRDNFWGS